MGFHFETQRPPAVKIDDAGVIHKYREAPRFIQFFRYPEDGAIHDVINGFAVVGDFGFKGLVHAVLGPGLGQRFQLDVGGIPAQFFVVIPDRRPLGVGKSVIQPQFFHRGFFVAHQVDCLEHEFVLRIGAENRFAGGNNAMDNGVHQQFATDIVQLFFS